MFKFISRVLNSTSTAITTVSDGIAVIADQSFELTSNELELQVSSQFKNQTERKQVEAALQKRRKRLFNQE